MVHANHSRGRRIAASFKLVWTEKQEFSNGQRTLKRPMDKCLFLCPRQNTYGMLSEAALPHPTLAAPTLLMKDANRLFRHLICSFSSLFTLCTVGSISSSRGTSRLSLIVTGVMQVGDPQVAPARYPKPGMPHLEATRGFPKPTLHRLREPRQPRARRPPPAPDRQDPLLTS